MLNLQGDNWQSAACVVLHWKWIANALLAVCEVSFKWLRNCVIATTRRMLLVRLLSTKKWQDRALCDKSIKLSLNTNTTMTSILWYGATSISPWKLWNTYVQKELCMGTRLDQKDDLTDLFLVFLQVFCLKYVISVFACYCSLLKEVTSYVTWPSEFLRYMTGNTSREKAVTLLFIKTAVYFIFFRSLA